MLTILIGLAWLSSCVNPDGDSPMQGNKEGVLPIKLGDFIYNIRFLPDKPSPKITGAGQGTETDFEMKKFALSISPVAPNMKLTTILDTLMAKEPSLTKDKFMQYIAFGMQPKVKLIINADTIPSQMHHFVSDGGIRNIYEILIGFDATEIPSVAEQENGFQILIDPGEMNKESLLFHFPSTNILSIPKLN